MQQVPLVSKTDEVASGTVTPPASIMRRVIATWIDAIVWMGLAFGSYIGAMFIIYGAGGEKWSNIVLVLDYSLMSAYFLPEVFSQRTLGKRMASIILLSRDGEIPSRRRRLVRWAIKSSPWLVALGQMVTNKWPIPETGVLQTLLVGYSDLLANAVAYLAWKIFDALGFGLKAEILVAPPVFAIRFLAGGMVPLTALVAGYVLICFPSRRTLLDRLSGTMVGRRRKESGRGFEPLPPSAGRLENEAGSPA